MNSFKKVIKIIFLTSILVVVAFAYRLFVDKKDKTAKQNFLLKEVKADAPAGGGGIVEVIGGGDGGGSADAGIGGSSSA